MSMKQLLTTIGRFWLPLAAVVILGTAILVGRPAWAAPDYQTVPLPTPTAEPAQPSPTPTRDADDDDANDDADAPGGGSVGSVNAPDEAPTELSAIVNAVRLNVRSGPGTDFAVIGTVGTGSQLRLIARDSLGSWWLICCAANGEQGWVSAQFLDANGLSRAEANALLPIADADGEVDTASTSATPQASQTPEAPQNEAAPEPALGLTLAVDQSPARVRQGDTLTLEYQLTNPGDETAVNVMLRSEVPAGLTLVDVVAVDAEQAETVIEPGRSAVLIVWPEVDAGADVTAAVTYTVDEDVPDGAVIDVIAASEADNAAFTSAGISVGMPPALLPTFQ